MNEISYCQDELCVNQIILPDHENLHKIIIIKRYQEPEKDRNTVKSKKISKSVEKFIPAYNNRSEKLIKSVKEEAYINVYQSAGFLQTNR